MKTSGGYVGLVAILVATVILVFLYSRTELSPTQTQVVSPSGVIESTTTITGNESAHQNLKTAELMQQKMNQQNQELNKTLGE
jgi:hypothetical protein